jgi:hypothetical protein
MKINEIEIDDLEPGDKQEFVPSNTNVSQSFSKFLANCSESVSEMKKANRFLYRGVNRPVSTIFVGASRGDRRNMGTPDDVQETLDDYLSGNDFSALRSNSIFCTGDRMDAGGYGDEYLIFPINGFNFTWNLKIHDFTLWLEEKEIWSFEEYLDNHPSFINSFRQTDLASAIRSKHEIMISGSYYAFNAEKYESYLRNALL